MKTLILLRHAKSDWDDPSLRDYDRPLAERGKRDAPRIGRRLAELGINPDLVIASGATRARQTIEAVSKAARFEANVQFDDRIYSASTPELAKVVRELPDQYSSAILVGHNPGFEDLLSSLTGKVQHMPTCTAACLRLAADTWSDVEYGEGTLEWFLRPKDL
jgi:phosphohistidine phosphatase